MNQILVTNDEKSYESRDMKVIVKFFAIISIIFALVLVGEGIFNLSKDASQKTEFAKPELSYAKSGSSLEVKISGTIGLNKVIYSWNNDEETVLKADGKKDFNFEVEIPQGENQFNARVIDVNGNKTKYDGVAVAFTELEDAKKPTIKIENVEGKLEVTATDDKELAYFIYQWEGEQENKVEPKEEDKTTIKQTIEVNKGTKMLTLIAVDKSGNKETKTKKIIGSNGPTISVELEDNNFVVKVKDEYGITKIEYTHNGETKEVKDIPSGAKEYEFKVPLKDEANYLKVNAYENGIMTEYKCKKTK